MKGKRIKQINNLVIYQDTAEKVNYFGEIRPNPNFGKCSVWTPDGRCWEDRMTLEQAEAFCQKTKDFVQKPRLDDQVAAASKKACTIQHYTTKKENER